jgi:hypothetical protein
MALLASESQYRKNYGIVAVSGALDNGASFLASSKKLGKVSIADFLTNLK